MQDSTFTISCLSVVTISMVLLTYAIKPRWIQAIASVGSALGLFGAIRFDYFHQPNAKYLFSIPGAALMGVSIILGTYRIITQWKRERV
jgi:hypothetical protein